LGFRPLSLSTAPGESERMCVCERECVRQCVGEVLVHRVDASVRGADIGAVYRCSVMSMVLCAWKRTTKPKILDRSPGKAPKGSRCSTWHRQSRLRPRQAEHGQKHGQKHSQKHSGKARSKARSKAAGGAWASGPPPRHNAAADAHLNARAPSRKSASARSACTKKKAPNPGGRAMGGHPVRRTTSRRLAEARPLDRSFHQRLRLGS